MTMINWVLLKYKAEVLLFEPTCLDFTLYFIIKRSRDSSLSTVMGYRLDSLGSIPGSARIFFSSLQLTV
jgi:hypothetical protein